MYLIKKFYGSEFTRINSVIDCLSGHINENINLIGSASLPFPEVCQIQNLPATACRVEGFWDSRFFPGTESITLAEKIIEDRMTQLFSITDTHEVNAQPHSATQSNQIVFKATLKRGNIVFYLSVLDGGHISHKYSLPDGIETFTFPMLNGQVNYDLLEQKIIQKKPRLIIVGNTSFPLEIDYPKLKKIANITGALLHADIAHTSPFIISKIHKPVLPYADFVTIDTGKNLRGPRGGILIYNKNYRNKIRTAIFPQIQSSPNQTALIAKAMCLSIWTHESMLVYAKKLIENINILITNLKSEGIDVLYPNSDTHLALLNLSKTIYTGKEFEYICAKNNIFLNRNQIPNDTLSPWIGSGVRLSSTSITILNYTESDIKKLGSAIISIYHNRTEHKEVIRYLIKKYHQGLSNIASE